MILGLSRNFILGILYPDLLYSDIYPCVHGSLIPSFLILLPSRC